LLRNDVKGLREVPDSKKRKELADNVEKKAWDNILLLNYVTSTWFVPT
jgi:hypothetical protein